MQTDKKILQRFMKYVDKTTSEKGCWLWLNYLDKGYGKFTFAGTRLLAHRASWLLLKGEIPSGLQINHNCDNPSCVNPEHLYVGTQLDNIEDMWNRKRGPSGSKSGAKLHPESILKGTAHHSAKLIEKQILEIRHLYSTEYYTQQNLADKYKVTTTTISKIVNNKHWKHVK